MLQKLLRSINCETASFFFYRRNKKHIFQTEDCICYVNSYFKCVNEEVCADCFNLTATRNGSMNNTLLRVCSACIWRVSKCHYYFKSVFEFIKYREISNILRSVLFQRGQYIIDSFSEAWIFLLYLWFMLRHLWQIGLHVIVTQQWFTSGLSCHLEYWHIFELGNMRS